MTNETAPSHVLLGGIVALTMAVVALTALVTYGYTQLANQGVTQAAQEQALIESCQRLNVLRVEDNRSHYADYQVFSFVADRSAASTKAETVAQAKATDELASVLRRAVREKGWTPATDCRALIDSHGGAYKSPAPIPFYKQLPPPGAM